MDEASTTNSTAGLRAVADLIDAHPDLPPPMVTLYASGSIDVDWFVNHGEQQREEMARIRRALGGKWEKNDAGAYFVLKQERGGFRLAITADREQVCERVVVGTEAVTVPAVEAQPERIVEREVVEWRCEPVLTEAGAA